VLASVTNTFALIGFGGTLAAYVGSELADNLLIDTGNDDAIGVGNVNSDTVDFRHNYLVRETEVHYKVFALLLNTVTNAENLKFLLVTFGYANNHVVEERACETVQCSVFFLIRRSCESDLSTFHVNCDIFVELLFQFTLGALNRNDVAVFDFSSNTCG